MQINRIPRIVAAILLAMAALSAVSCVYDFYEETEVADGSIHFTLSMDASSLATRAGADSETTYQDALPLTGPGGDTLYLHPSVSPTPLDVNPLTKASAVTDENITEFYVRAYNSSDGLYKEDTKVTRTSASWVPESPILWPVDGELNFYAHHFREAEGNAAPAELHYGLDDHTISFDWNTPVSPDKLQDAKYQPDLIFAYENALRPTLGADKVQLDFFHALSEVKFKVGDVFDGVVKTITIKGIYGGGTCTFNGNETVKDMAQNRNPMSWVLDENTKNSSYTQTFNVEVKDQFDPANPDAVPTPQPITDKIPETTFMLVPQRLYEAEVTVVMDRMDNGTATEISLTGKINVDWKAGYTYTYLISTDSVNWIYVFDVIGSEQQENEDNPAAGTFSDHPTNIVINPTVTEGCYYKVQSYRYRANHPEIRETVPWRISSEVVGTLNTESISHIPESAILEEDKHLYNRGWIPVGLRNSDVQDGSFDYTKIDITFSPQMVATDWAGDWELRRRDEIGTYNNAVDLSMVTGSKNTANCYVVCAGGHYKFPLVYGSSIVNGQTVTSSYVNTSSGGTHHGYPKISNFTDYQGNAITGPDIQGAVSATLVWEDAYNLVSEVQLKDNYVSFYVNNRTIQQGNAVIAVKDASGKIIWSWHIWVTEHWTAWQDGADVNSNLKIGHNDVECDALDKNWTYTVAPYDLGWCDAKNVWYLMREGNLHFAQVYQEFSNIPTGKVDQLYVAQREQKIEYWIGNNTYYQFGRKDPFVGFRGTESQVKYNFGPMPYVVPTEQEFKRHTIAESIQNPNVLFVGGPSGDGNDWLQDNMDYYNLWNNTNMALPVNTPDEESIEDYHYSGVKTVYDPSPPGYQVPPVGFFRIFTKKALDGNELTVNDINNGAYYFNGTVTYKGDGTVNAGTKNIKYYIWDALNYKPTNSLVSERTHISFTYTGHRWYSYTHFAALGAGYNYNPQIVYIWSNQIHFHVADNCGYGLALGNDEVKSDGTLIFAVTFRFPGRRSMARPVRPVRQFTDDIFN